MTTKAGPPNGPPSPDRAPPAFLAAAASRRTNAGPPVIGVPFEATPWSANLLHQSFQNVLKQVWV